MKNEKNSDKIVIISLLVTVIILLFVLLSTTLYFLQKDKDLRNKEENLATKTLEVQQKEARLNSLIYDSTNPNSIVRIEGVEIVSVTDNQLTVIDKGENSQTLTLTSATNYQNAGSNGTKSALRKGMRVDITKNLIGEATNVNYY